MKALIPLGCCLAVWTVVIVLVLDSGLSSAAGPESRPAGALEREPRPLVDDEAPELTVAVAGDVHGEPPIRGLLEAGANPLADMAAPLRAADVAVVNVETAVGTGGTQADKQFRFRASSRIWGALRRSGVDVVSLANNHALDYGRGMLPGMLRGARRAGLQVVGAGRSPREAYAPAVVRRGPHRVAVVGLTRVIPEPGWAAARGRPGLASAYDEAAAVRAVRAAARRADHVVVAIHWGDEVARCPNGVQRGLAARLARAGADVIAGHHPHVLQPIETRGHTLVAYSLGNFAFYARDEITRHTGVLTARLAGGRTRGRRFAPARIDALGRPRPTRDAAARPMRTATSGRACRDRGAS